jgi:hypothetical protein
MNSVLPERRRQAVACAESILLRAGLADRPFTPEELVARSELVVGHPITLMLFECPPGGDGAVFWANGRYIICYRTNTDEIHRRHIIMHEFAHMYLGHRPAIKNGWITFTADEEQYADLVAEHLVDCSLNPHTPRWPNLSRWLRQCFHAEVEIDQSYLGSIFD